MVNIPTITDLYNDILADLQTSASVTIPVFGKSFLRALAGVQAAKLKLYYLAIGLLQKNIFVDTADPEAVGGTLERFGRVKIGRDPFPATQGQYEITVTLEANEATVIKAGTTFKGDINGKLYILDAEAAPTYPTDTIIVRALEAGTDGLLNIGDTLTATAPMINVSGAAVVAGVTVIPIAAETTEDYRAKIIQSYRLYPQGGASADYRLWGLDANGVKQIYPYAASGAPNEVNVFVEATIAASTDAMGTPTTAILDDVEANMETDPITGKGRRPLGVFAVNVVPVAVNQIAITIPSSSSISAADKTLITTALTQAVNAVRPFIAGADVLATKNDTFGINNITSVILSTVPGASFAAPTMNITAGGVTTPETTRVYDLGNIPFLTSVTYA